MKDIVHICLDTKICGLDTWDLQPFHYVKAHTIVVHNEKGDEEKWAKSQINQPNFQWRHKSHANPIHTGQGPF